MIPAAVDTALIMGALALVSTIFEHGRGRIDDRWETLTNFMPTALAAGVLFGAYLYRILGQDLRRLARAVEELESSDPKPSQTVESGGGP